MPLDVRAPGQTRPVFETDLWDGYRPARARLIGSIRKHGLKNVVIASGDHHKHGAGTLPERPDAPDGKAVAVEFLASSISSGGNGAGEAGSEHVLANNPHWDIYTNRRGYQLFDISPTRWINEVKVMDEVEMAGGTVRPFARYEVTPDVAKLNRVG